MSRQLKICFTADSHGYLYPTDFVHPGDQPMGLMKAAADFPHDGNTLILDGGDSLQGSPMAACYHSLTPQERSAMPHPFAAMMNLAGYQYVVPGNHDFNFGVSGLQAYLEALDARCLCCNIRDRAGRLPIRPWVIHTLENGLRIGLVGACTDVVAQWEKPETVAELELRDCVEACGEALEAVRSQCDMTVLIYHGGFACDLTDGQVMQTGVENRADELCRKLDFDLVLTAHQHTSIPCQRFGNSWIAQPACHGRDFCRITVEIGEDGVISVQGTNEPPAECPLDGAELLLAPLRALAERYLSEHTNN